MILRVDGRRYRGEAIDVHDVDPGAVCRALRGEPSRVSARAPGPGPVHEYVGHVPVSASVPVRAALAAAARTRGQRAPQDDELERVRAELHAIDPVDVDREGLRRRVAAAGEREERLHERVAELRGRVRTLRERSADPSDAERRLREAAAELTETRTERIAAQQELDDLRGRLERSRDRRERRLRLRDRADNLRRGARERLAAALWDRFRAAVAAVPGDATVGEAPGEVGGDGVAVALAVARLAERSAPVVLSCERFADADAAAASLGPPVIRVAPSGG
jgi:hypothetical protein